MRFIRKKIVLRSFSAFCVVVMLNSIVFPTGAYALTTGPHQPEFASYEGANATDMVNLPTGDFTYNTTLLTVPNGESSGFPIPLFYHGGIGPDEEASWVGLGFNINVGSITRDINGFPDDANNDPRVVNVQQLNVDHGWTSSFLGSEIGWDAEEGHYGVVDLTLGGGLAKFGYGKEKGMFEIACVTFKDGDVKFDAREFALKLFEIAMAVITDGATEVAGTIVEDVAISAVMGGVTSGVEGIVKGEDDIGKSVAMGALKGGLSGAAVDVGEHFKAVKENKKAIAKEVPKGTFKKEVREFARKTAPWVKEAGDPKDFHFWEEIGKETLKEINPLPMEDGKFSKDQALEMAGDLLADAYGGGETPEVGPEGYWETQTEFHKKLFRTNYTINIKASRTENMFGVLHLERSATQPLSGPNGFLMPENYTNTANSNMNQFELSTTLVNNGAASDINIDMGQEEYWNNQSPALLAYDNYSVKGPGVSGTIKPYRLEVGSVAVPREMTSNHWRLNPAPFLDYGTNKVPFVYDGAKGNGYFNHVGIHHTSGAHVIDPNFYFGLNSGMEVGSVNYLRYDIDDEVLGTVERIRQDVAARRKLPQGYFVEWLNNAEVTKSSTAVNPYSGFSYMDYFRPADRAAFRHQLVTGHPVTFNAVDALSFDGSTITFPANRGFGDEFIDTELVSVHLRRTNTTTGAFTDYNYSNVPVLSHTPTQITLGGSMTPLTQITGFVISADVTNDGTGHRNNNIGGFVITDPSGTSYHYALPIVDDTFFTKTWDKNDPTKFTTIARDISFANTWLLTAITGPDFVDRGGSTGVGDGFIDENDWGYWVKFNYAKSSNGSGQPFKWATPHNTTTGKASPDDKSMTIAQGNKEKYYLNSVETRSHIALFIKDTRQDSKNDAGASESGTLRLSEIDLITKDMYQPFNLAASLADASGKTGPMYLKASIPTAALNFLHAVAIKAVIFNQDFSLCPSTPTSTSGKLTLNSVTICKFDPNTFAQIKIMPDYRFSYDGPNPLYDDNKWDGWGMYASGGTASGLDHQVKHSSTTDGTEWQLTKVTTPEGEEIQVSYERDSYEFISGDRPPITDFNMTGVFNTLTPNGTISSFTTSAFGASAVKAGDALRMIGSLRWKCGTDSTFIYFGNNATSQEVTYFVSSVSGTQVNLSASLGNVACPANQPVKVQGKFVPRVKKGGNTRVTQISLNDPAGQSFKTQYQYGPGTVSVEPGYIRTSEMDFYSYLNYPTTPIMYGAVTVLTGKLTTPTDFHTQTDYAFQKPDKSLYTYSLEPSTKKQQVTICTTCGPKVDKSSLYEHRISDRSTQIGKILSVSIKDAAGSEVQRKDYTYTETPLNSGSPGHQGTFSEGTLLFEAIQGDDPNIRYHRAQRTTSLKFPFMLQKVVTTKDGFVSQTENKDWDSKTGAVLDVRTTSPTGFITRTASIPAYTIYPELGFKSDLSTNKNMVGRMAAVYVFKADASGNQLGLIKADITTFKKDWNNYRTFDLPTTKFVNTTEPSWPQVTRPYQTYKWRGTSTSLQPDGTHTFNDLLDPFLFTAGATNPKWTNASTTKRYNHNSEPLEVRDINGVHSARIMGYIDRYKIADVSNAHFEEIAYSGAEDDVTGTSPNTFFGGEVKLGDGVVITGTPTNQTHTGTKSLQVPGNGHGFIFKSDKVFNTKAYKASVWCSSNTGKIYYKINGGAEVANAPTTSTQIGLWYKLDYVIPPYSMTAGTYSIEIGVRSAATPANYDDFRFQPLISDMTTYVYDNGTRNLIYSLNNDNFYTQFEYDNKGILVKTYEESVTFNGGRLTSEVKRDYRRFHTNQ